MVRRGSMKNLGVPNAGVNARLFTDWGVDRSKTLNTSTRSSNRVSFPKRKTLEIRMIVIDDGDGEQAVARGDRVELFFTSDPELRDYICFEIDPSGRVVDYRAAYYREFDRDWHLPELVVAAVLTETGYIVEGRIPHAAFRDAGLPTLADDGKVLAGVFRAEYSHRDEGEPLAEWISWVTPSSEEPDFHIPSAFGWLQTR